MKMQKNLFKLLVNRLHSDNLLSPLKCFNSCFFQNFSTSEEKKYDVCIVGAGIVGLATAQELINRYPLLKFIVVEKEDKIAAHQSGHNSGVVHAGMYYTPGTLKAKLCVEGNKLAYKYFEENNVPYRKCGKLIVATSPEQVKRLDAIAEKGKQNGVEGLKMLQANEIKQVEPNCVGLKALHSPYTGIVDWGFVTTVYGKKFVEKGGEIKLNWKVDDFKESEDSEHPVVVTGLNMKTNNKERLLCKNVLTCGGLYSDKLAEKSGCEELPKIVAFRGDYLLLKPEKASLVNGNIYPVPDPKFPFLGVHFTPRINGDVWLGPNAVLAFRREGYNLLDFKASELYDALAFRGLRRMIFSNLSYAFGELYKGINIRAQVEDLRKFVPSLHYTDVVRGPSGVRAQALDAEGKFVDDFVFDHHPSHLGRHTLHVRNAPSPAATSSLGIAKAVADRAQELFQLF